MALEAGHQMHEVFSAARLWQLEYKQNLPEHARVAGHKLFGKQRWTEIVKHAATEAPYKDDHRQHLFSVCFKALHTGTFYDQPDDDIRTITNMESATLNYINARLPLMESWPIFVDDERDPHCLVGVEQVFDVMLEYSDGTLIRNIGTIDGLEFSRHYKRLFLAENKTASRLDDGWVTSFDMSHQITGYCATTGVVWKRPVLDAHVFGVKIKPGRAGDNLRVLLVERTEESIQTWARWVHWTVKNLYDPFVSHTGDIDFESAPRFTHSCNRYFRACSLVPFCTDTAEGRQEQWEQMVEAPLSPSEQAVMEIF
jgi:hypothetical protein